MLAGFVPSHTHCSSSPHAPPHTWSNLYLYTYIYIHTIPELRSGAGFVPSHTHYSSISRVESCLQVSSLRILTTRVAHTLLHTHGPRRDAPRSNDAIYIERDYSRVEYRDAGTGATVGTGTNSQTLELAVVLARSRLFQSRLALCTDGTKRSL